MKFITAISKRFEGSGLSDIYVSPGIIADEAVEKRAKRLEDLRVRAEERRWKCNLIKKSSQNFICTSKVRYQCRNAVTPIIFGGNKPTFTSDELVLLTLNNATVSMDGYWYVC